MASTAKTLTFVIPAYNMESYLDRCVNSLLSASDISDLEVLIVDDGSKDGTLEYARKLERTNPGAVRAIHQENKGHGGAVNTGIAAATGMYVKVVDADDWVDPQAIDTVLATLRAQHDTDEPIDMLVTNYVYDKVAKRHKTVVNFRRVMEAGRVLGWDDLGKFGLAQYIIMHALTFRTQVVRDSGLKLPEHTFYVDFYYSYQPFPWVKRIQYLDVPFYHYFIGHSAGDPMVAADGLDVPDLVHIRNNHAVRFVGAVGFEPFAQPRDALARGGDIRQLKGDDVFLTDTAGLLGLIIGAVRFADSRPQLDHRVRTEHALVDSDGFGGAHRHVVFVGTGFGQNATIIQHVRCDGVPARIVR